jgi:predicted RNase H-like HicB family nuclease
MNLKIMLEPGEDGDFFAHVPTLKSCWSQGKTREEALDNICEAIDLYLEGTSINSELAVAVPLVLGNMGIPTMGFMVGSNK